MKNNLKKYTRPTPQHPTPNLLFNCIFLSKKRKAIKTILKTSTKATPQHTTTNSLEKKAIKISRNKGKLEEAL